MTRGMIEAKYRKLIEEAEREYQTALERADIWRDEKIANLPYGYDK